MREVKEMMSSEVGCRVERRLQPNAGKEGSGPPGEALITICPGLGAAKKRFVPPLVWPSWATERRGPGQIVSRPSFNDFWTNFGRPWGARGGCPNDLSRDKSLEMALGARSYKRLVLKSISEQNLMDFSIDFGIIF